MSTSDQISAEIVAARQRLIERQGVSAEAQEAIVAAQERQSLRRELEAIQKQIGSTERVINARHATRRDIDNDLLGDHLPHNIEPVFAPRMQPREQRNRHLTEVADCTKAISVGEQEWKIAGMSWLVNTLEQMEERYAESCAFTVGNETFCLCYHPEGGVVGLDLGDQDATGSLVVKHEDTHGRGLTFRHSFFIKNSAGEFVQWGNTGNECFPDSDTACRVYGPDVSIYNDSPELTSDRVLSPAAGIFGLKHADLYRSEWCTEDTLIVKCKLEVRQPDSYGQLQKPIVVLPPITISTDWLALLDSGNGADVAFEVDGCTDQILAHSAVLMARSDVFARQLNSGMKEAAERRIKISEFQRPVFDVMLRFLYSDDLDVVDKSVDGGASGLDVLQSLLAISHKYQLQRLLLWCEKKLCDLLSTENVCVIICQAHVYEANVLEAACLDLICANFECIVVSPAYGLLSKEWPPVVLKIQLHSKNIAKETAIAAFRAQDEASDADTTSHKRKRADD